MRKILPFLLVFAAASSSFAANPTITSINPSCAIAGGPQFTLTVIGTNYDNTSVVRWNGANLATTFVSSTQLTAIVPAANIATAGTAQVTVKNSTGSASNSVTFTIVAPPTISSLNPTCATAGGLGFTLTVNGTNFAAISTVNWNGTALTTTFVSATQLTATVPAALIATAGTASITVVSCGGTSNAQTFTIAATPVITSPLTACGTVGVAFSYTITATNNPTSFSASPLPPGLTVNTSTGVISGTATTAGTTNVTITASNGATPCNTSAQQTLVITISAVPTVSSLNPTCATAGGPQLTLTVNGINFVSGSAVKWNATALTTTFVSSTQLTATVPASLIATAGSASVTVVNPNPCGATSNAVTFTIANTPVITSPLTACGTVGVAFSYTITATNNPTSFSATGLPPGLSVNTSTGVISGTPTTAGTSNVTISASNGASSCNTGSATLVITTANTPVITSPLTACGTVGVAFSYTITATNSPTSYNATGLPPGLNVNTSTGIISGTPTTAGTSNVTITASNGASPCNNASATLVITISARPTIGSISPTCAAAGGPGFTLTVNGTNFVSTSTVNWNGTALTTTFVSSTQLTAAVPASLIATAGTPPITVVNPCGGTSTGMTFTIANPPVITSPLTACGTVGVAFSYAITATNSPNSYNATGLPAGLNVTRSTGVISGTPTTAGTFNVTISASNGAGAGPCNTGSATLVITISAAPTLSSLNPTCATAGGPQFTLTVNGTNFVSTSTVKWNATALATTFVSSTQLTATVPASLIATAGTASVTVVNPNPCGATSSAVTFTIANPPVITSPLTACGTVGVAFSYAITATNSPNSYNATGLPAGLSVNTSTGVISGTPTTAGTSNVTISASNGASPCNTGSATLVITISARPTIGSISPTCVAAGGPGFTLTVNGTNFVSTSTVNWNGTALATTYISSAQLTATVPASLIASPGTASITVVNPNPCGATSTAVTFTIANMPVITSPLTASGQIGVAFSYTITATNTNNGTTYCAAPLPPGLSLGNGSNRNVISGTPTTAGTTNVIIKVFNGAGSCGSPPTCYAQATLVITICPQDPAITSPLTASATLGTPFTYQITADNNPISFDANDLPGGLTVNTTTGLISGTPTATGVFPVTIFATSNNAGPCGSSTATDTLILTVTMPGGIFIPPFPGQINVFGWGPTPPGPNDHIPFPNATTDNYFVLYWNAPGSNTNQSIADSANGGLRRSADTTGMSYNPYDPTIANSRPDPTKNVWRGNPVPPNDNTSGQFGDPRASWYVTDPWSTADYVTGSYWAGPIPNVVPLNWPDSGHPFSYNGLQPTGKGQYPTDIMASPTPSPDPTKAISLLSDPNRPNAGNLTSITELGNVWDPAQLSYAVVNPGGALPDIPTSALRDSRGAGGHTLAIGRPEFSMFDQPPIGGNLMRAWQLLDLFSGKTSNTNFTSTAGLVNLNTASRDVLRSLAVGILQNSDPAIQPASLLNNLYPPTATGANIQQADKFADAVINSRPLLSASALSAIRDCGQSIPCASGTPQPFFGNSNQYIGSTQPQPTEWNDAAREELFAKIYNLATTRSRNFRVFVTGQSLDKNGRVLSTVTKVYHVFIKPNRDPTTGAIQSQQVQIKYEGSM